MASHGRTNGHIHARSALLALLAVGGLTAAASAQAQVVYFENFEDRSQYPEWTTPVLTEAPGTVFTRFLGRYLNDHPTLTVNLPQPPLRNTSDGSDGGSGGGGSGGGSSGGGGTFAPYVLSFDFYCIDSWDGSEPTYGPDRFQVLLNNAVALLDATFANQHTNQTYPGSPAVGRSQLGFDERWNDSIYHISLPFNASTGTATFRFEAFGLTGMTDESWGIDNVKVIANPVPAPGAAAILGLTGLGVATRRRRPSA